MPLTLLLSVPASVCPAFGGLAPGLIVFLAVFLWGLGTLGPGREWFLWSRFGLGLTGFLPRAFRCPWPPPGFPWQRKGVLKCNSFRSMCGGTIMNRYRLASGWGASPRMWGNLRDDKTVVNGFGSIPSYVGEPTGPGPRAGRDTEHPLVCGGTRHLPARRGPEHGASPRMWGNPLGRDILYPFLTLLWTLSCWWEGGPSSGGWRFGAFGHDMPCPACRGVLFSVR